MRILITTILVRSGQTTHVWDLVNTLHSQGHEVAVAILVKNKKNIVYGGNLSKSDVNALFKPIEGVSYHYYNKIQELKNIIKKHKVEILHAHSSLTFALSLKAAKTFKIPLILTLHGVNNWGKKFPNTLSYASKIIAIGPPQAKSLPPSASEKLHLIYNGINLNKYVPNYNTFKLSPKSSTCPLKIIWFGRLDQTSSSGVEVLNQAISELRKKGKNIEARLIGTPGKAKVDQFNAYGWINNPIPHLQWAEIAFCHGRALMEAMACGNIGIKLAHGYGGLVQNDWFSGKTPKPLGALREYNLPKPNHKEIAALLSELYDDNKKLLNLRKEACDISKNYFGVEFMVNKTVALYEEALKGNK
ncbi:glycosyltransferase family 4 protein [Halobacillus yeomjeoni]|uniref:Glycosyltransferase family 4 protein n=1 Tax=Halobacillus yeomjeoni TaxID=311194 RepID=A0A931HYG2_9BACI|nr:glycosyltransferase family 4 protein [Halobacillus yeomjeoni]MBH0231536.1 glycosyltransferase family 4 protein [Halobacillus yeomjeoni]